MESCSSMAFFLSANTIFTILYLHISKMDKIKHRMNAEDNKNIYIWKMKMEQQHSKR